MGVFCCSRTNLNLMCIFGALSSTYGTDVPHFSPPRDLVMHLKCFFKHVRTFWNNGGIHLNIWDGSYHRWPSRSYWRNAKKCWSEFKRNTWRQKMGCRTCWDKGPRGERADAPMLGSRWRNTQSSSMLSLLCRDWTPQSNWNWGMKSLLRDKNKLTINSWKPHFLFSRSVRDVFVSSSFIHLMVFIATSGFCEKKHPGDQRPFQLCPERMCSNTGLAYSFGDIGRHGSTAGAQGEVTKKKTS